MTMFIYVLVRLLRQNCSDNDECVLGSGKGAVCSSKVCVCKQGYEADANANSTCVLIGK